MTARNGILAAILLVATIGAAVGPASAVSTEDSVEGPAVDRPGTTDGGVDASVTQQDCSFPVSVTDTTGTEVTLEQQPQRIVALQPSDAQTLWEIGVQDRVVGLPVTQYTAYLANRSQRTNVKNEDLSVNVEQVVGLNPDLVLAANVTSIETVRQLRASGITVYHFGQVQSIDEIRTNVETVGRLTGACEPASTASTAIQSAVNAVEQAASESETRPRALYYFFGTTTGPGTHIHDVLTTAGAVNVAAEAGVSGYAQLNAEVVAQQDPDWIVHPDDATIPDEEPYTSTTAVQQNQTIALNSNYISQPGPRVVVPLSRLARTWYPEAINRTESTADDDGNNSLAPSMNTSTPTETATRGSGPGFGAGVTAMAVLVAVAGLLVVARRRP